MADFYGWNPPFIGGVQNVLSRQEDVRLIQNDILQLLLTIPGERVMRPRFGVNLRNFVFELLDDMAIASLKVEITSAIQRYEPRVIVNFIELTPNADSHRLNIEIHAKLKSDPTKDVTVELFLENPTSDI